MTEDTFDNTVFIHKLREMAKAGTTLPALVREISQTTTMRPDNGVWLVLCLQEAFLLGIPDVMAMNF